MFIYINLNPNQTPKASLQRHKAPQSRDFFCVEVFFLEYHSHAEILEHAGVFQAIQGVSGKAGGRLGQDNVHLAALAQGDELIKLSALLGAGAGYTLICENADQSPVGIVVDLIRIMGYLVFVACDLFFIVGAGVFVAFKYCMRYGESYSFVPLAVH